MITLNLIASNLFALLLFAAFFTVVFVALIVFTRVYVSKAKSYVSIDFGSTLERFQMSLKTIMFRLTPAM